MARRRLTAVQVVHQLIGMDKKVVTVKCGATGVVSLLWSAWHSDVTCFDCLNGGVVD